VNAADEDEARTKELDACKQADSDSRHKKVTKLGVKRTVEDQSANEDDPSDETFDAPAPKHRTQRIVVGNRYVEVPAFDEDTDDEGSRVGSVVKAGAAAVVVGTAAVATGVVAAKAIDYVEDHKGGISDAAHDLKDKIRDRLTPSRSGELSQAASGLKDKIKDRLGDGGGFNKVATGLKDKIKDRLTPSRSGGLSKAASGLKEKFKSRLTGGGGDGGGIASKMKGVAKAGGGLLRRLAGR
jgi:predicted Rdx family selenoprotein